MSGHTENSVVIDSSLERVWAMTNDVASWPWLFSEYASAEILNRSEDTVLFRLTTHPDEQDRTWAWVSERRLDPGNHVVRARRVEAGPFEYMNIRWEYHPVDGGVEMRWFQDFHMKPTAPVDDAAMAERINQNTPVQMARIKMIIESGCEPDAEHVPAPVAHAPAPGERGTST
jgi:aromatase